MINEKENAFLRELKAWLAETENTPLEEMDAFFTQRVHGYETHMLSHWSADYVRLADALPADTGRILDLGCGTGLELDEIFRRFPDMRVTGIDLTAAMLEKLREKHGSRALELICGSYFTEPFPGPFDAVVSFESLHHFTAAEKLPLYKKVFDALKPGGVFLNCDYIACCGEVETLLRETCIRRRKQAGIPDSVFIHFDTPLTAEHELQVLRDAGFADVSAAPGPDAVLITAKKAS
ncbi:MAG: class I SAM-dependent methyltransferase [Hominenteromicrobium sp.]